MDLLNDLTSSTGDNPLIVFDCDSVNPLDQLKSSSDRKETGDSKPKSRNGDKLELKHFHDQTLAQDYVCKICQFMVVDPREHNVIGSTFTCASLFCYNCICNWIKSGKSYCPSPGCLTIGFEESAFREIGARDVARLSGLMMNCPFSCGLKLTYSDYTFLSHRNQCPSNPENMCKICKSPKLDSGGGHDCRIVFNEMRQKIDSLNIKVSKLNGVIDQLRSELATAKKEETKTKNGPSGIKKEAIGKDKKGVNDQKGKDNQPIASKTDAKINKRDLKSLKITTEKQNSSKEKQLISETKSGDKDGGQAKESNKISINFYSNSYYPLGTFGSFSGINLVFHYGKRSINFYDVASTSTVRDFRRCITTIIGHDPGLMLFIRHTVLYRCSGIKQHCGFRMGNNVVTILPVDTPNYEEPDCRIPLYLPSENINAISKNSRLLNFYSNNLDSQRGADGVQVTLVSDNSSFMIDSVDDEMTLGDIRHKAAQLIGKSDITLIPGDGHFKYDANDVLHLNRFQENKSLANKPSNLSI
ncbi:uncharacterized protein LOC128386552 [Panonychus citri]|uniref:uncharacterized protein LOC128386552 n=1 Tax=Panonychus citri TaxID=50023 RepID=UPI0023074352|nr:uncharacterized protein LOC128386552 [Panonychus citri]